MEGKQTLIQQFFSSPAKSTPSTAEQSEYPPIAITPLRPEAAEAMVVVVAGMEEEMDAAAGEAAMLLTLSGRDSNEQGQTAVYEAGEEVPIVDDTPKAKTGEKKKVPSGKKVTFPTHLKKAAATSRSTPPRTRRNKQQMLSTMPNTLEDDEEHKEDIDRELQSLRKDNRVMSKQLAEVMRDLEEMRAWRREMEESSPSCSDLSKRLNKMEAICSKALDTKKLVKDLQQETQQVKGRQDELESAVMEAKKRMDNLEEAQATARASLEARYKESVAADQRLAELEKKAGIETQPPHESMQAFYLTGLGDLAAAAEQHLQKHSDPIVLIRNLLRYLDLEQHMTRIHLINVSVTEAGRSARSAVIFMTSAFHKNEAIVRVKTFLRQKALNKVQAEDCFPPSQLEAVRALRSHGHQLKSGGQIAKYRVINREGMAVLQTGTTTDGRYEDTPLPAGGSRRTGEDEATGNWRRQEWERSREAGGRRPTLTGSDERGQLENRSGEGRPHHPPARREGRQRPSGGGSTSDSDHKMEARAKERQAPRYRDSDRYGYRQHRRRDEPHSSSRVKEAGARDLYYSPPKGPVPVEYGGPRSGVSRPSNNRKAV